MSLHARRANLVLGGTAVAAAVGAAGLPRIPQDPGYHLCADTRVVLGVPSGLKVLARAQRSPTAPSSI